MPIDNPYLYREGARVYHSADQAIPDSTWTALAFDSERWDTDTIHDPVANNSRLTCKTPGKYIISLAIRFDAHATGFRVAALRVNVPLLIAAQENPPGLSDYVRFTVTTIWDLALNAYVEAYVWQNSGGALNVLATAGYSPEFMMQRIG